MLFLYFKYYIYFYILKTRDPRSKDNDDGNYKIHFTLKMFFLHPFKRLCTNETKNRHPLALEYLSQVIVRCLQFVWCRRCVHSGWVRLSAIPIKITESHDKHIFLSYALNVTEPPNSIPGSHFNGKRTLRKLLHFFIELFFRLLNVNGMNFYFDGHFFFQGEGF